MFNDPTLIELANLARDFNDMGRKLRGSEEVSKEAMMLFLFSAASDLAEVINKLVEAMPLPPSELTDEERSKIEDFDRPNHDPPPYTTL